MKKTVKICSLVMAIVMLFAVLQTGVVTAFASYNYVDEKTGVEITLNREIPENASFYVLDSKDEVHGAISEMFLGKLDKLGYTNYRSFLIMTTFDDSGEGSNIGILEGIKTVSVPIPNDASTENIEVFIPDSKTERNHIIPYNVVDGKIVFTSDESVFAVIVSDKRDPLYITSQQTNEILHVVGEEGVLRKVGLFESYKKSPCVLNSLVTDSRIKTVKWTSDNKKVTVDENGVVTNTSILCQKANITATGYDSDGNVVSSAAAEVLIAKTTLSMLILKFLVK